MSTGICRCVYEWMVVSPCWWDRQSFRSMSRWEVVIHIYCRPPAGKHSSALVILCHQLRTQSVSTPPRKRWQVFFIIQRYNIFLLVKENKVLQFDTSETIKPSAVRSRETRVSVLKTSRSVRNLNHTDVSENQLSPKRMHQKDLSLICIFRKWAFDICLIYANIITSFGGFYLLFIEI